MSEEDFERGRDQGFEDMIIAITKGFVELQSTSEISIRKLLDQWMDYHFERDQEKKLNWRLKGND